VAAAAGLGLGAGDDLIGRERAADGGELGLDVVAERAQVGGGCFVAGASVAELERRRAGARRR
jgi:hypothetical protein